MAMQSQAIDQVNSLNVKAVTKVRFGETLQLMLDSEDKKYCSIFRNELQGMLNALELECIISTEEHKRLSETFGSLWKAKAKAFYLTSRAVEKTQSN